MQTLPADPVIPLFEGEGFADSNDNFAEGEGAAWCVAFTEDGQPVRESYVNLIPTSRRRHARQRPARRPVQRGQELHRTAQPAAQGREAAAEDVFARASYVLSAKVLDPQFQGQIKERLNSRDAVRLVSSFVRPALELWLNQHVEYGKKLAELAIKAAAVAPEGRPEGRKAQGLRRRRAARQADRLREQGPLAQRGLPGGGDSAGGSAKMGRDKECQAILPLRGKVLNTWEVERDRLFANTEIHDIAVAIGVDPHGPNDTPDLSGLRYGKICILSDADVDGSHIQVLLLTLFFRHFPKLIDPGNVYVRRPPLFRVTRRRAARSRRPSLCAGRGRTHGHPGQAAQGRRARRGLEHQPLQGPGRNERGTTLGTTTQSGHPPPAARAPGRDGFRADREPDHQADGQGRSSRPPRTDGTARRRRGDRQLDTARMTAANFAASSPDRTTARVRLRPDDDERSRLRADARAGPRRTWPSSRPGSARSTRPRPLPDFRTSSLKAATAWTPVGFLILIGCRSQHQSLELKRMVVQAKHQGFGRAALRVIKKIAFDDLGRTASGWTSRSATRARRRSTRARASRSRASCARRSG
jgi:topoisomerase-4 subunit B